MAWIQLEQVLLVECSTCWDSWDLGCQKEPRASPGDEHDIVERVARKLRPHQVGQDGHHAKHANQNRNQDRSHHGGFRVEEDEQGKILPSGEAQLFQVPKSYLKIP